MATGSAAITQLGYLGAQQVTVVGGSTPIFTLDPSSDINSYAQFNFVGITVSGTGVVSNISVSYEIWNSAASVWIPTSIGVASISGFTQIIASNNLRPIDYSEAALNMFSSSRTIGSGVTAGAINSATNPVISSVTMYPGTRIAYFTSSASTPAVFLHYRAIKFTPGS
jgi:hypothetical protein